MVTNTVTFVGNAAQLLATYRSIGGAATALQREISSLNKASFQRQGFAVANPFEKIMGPNVRNIRTEWDAVNKVLRTTGDTFIDLGKNGSILTGTLEKVHSNTDAILKSASNYSQVLEKNNSALTASRNAYLATAQPIRQRINLLRQQLALEVEQGIISRKTATSIVGRELRLGQYQTRPLYQDYVNQRRVAAAAISAADEELQRALHSPITRSPASIRAIPPNILNELYKRGLPTSPLAQFEQGAKATLTGDIIRGTTRANVSFKDQAGVLRQAQVEWDKYGKSVTRFGGNLSGIQNLLTQTVRNLQKVIQWTVATTVVFGTLAFAAQELGTIVTIDKNLKQLSITAQATQQQTKGLFSGLADIAFETATPLDQIVKSADDIALAVRKSGSSAQEYQQDILNLAKAVGIYTNLTGTDTVQATDLLTSAMKQLGIQTEDVVGILSKVTAVAGGQSSAISDITQVLAVMSEAARQAGLSIDETIATAQVLSQVTAKSPAEIATAFKNLTGSLDSVAGSKALAKFNIDLRDSAGNLRNILDIYGEISDKIRQGIIPADQVKGLVKAIAGGPRRVPDAAALLSNIDTIEQVTERSVNATNEALIANAKILDTTQAKLTQLKVLVDKFAFEKFGPALKQGVEIFLDATTKLFEILNKIDAGWISAGIQAGVFLLALKLGISILTRFTGGLVATAFALKNNAAAALLAAKGYQQLAASEAEAAAIAARPGGPLGLVSGIGKAGLKAGAAGAITGAGITALSGGSFGQIAGGGLQGAGIGLFTVPSPEPYTKVAGAALFAVGTLLQFVTATNDAGQATKDLGVTAEDADKALSAFSSYTDAVNVLENLGQTQKELKLSITSLNGEQNKTADQLAVLNDFQGQYVKNALEMADANVKLRDSQKTLNEIVPGFEQAIESAKKGLLSKEQIDKFLSQYQAAILKKTNPDLVLPDKIGIPVPQRLPTITYSNEDFYKQQQKKLGQNIPFPTIATGRELISSLNGPDILGKSFEFDLREMNLLADGYKKVKSLFKGDLFDPTTISVTGENLDLISAALQKLVDSGDAAAPALQKAFNAFLQQNNAFQAADVNLALFQSRIQAMAAIGDPAAGELQKVYDLVAKIVDISKEKGDTNTLFKAQAYLSDVLLGKIKITKDNLSDLATIYARQIGALPPSDIQDTQSEARLSGLNKVADSTQVLTDKNIALQAILDDLGLNYDLLGEKGSSALAALSEDTINLLTAIDETKQSILSDIASKSADLQARKQGGEFKDNPQDYTAQINQLQALKEEINGVSQAFAQSAEALGATEFQATLETFEASLTNIPGLEDAVGLSANDLIARFFQLADTYNLTGRQIEILGGQLQQLGINLGEIGKIRATFHLDADLTAAIAKLRALRASMAALSKSPFFTIQGAGSQAAGLSEIDAAIATLQGAANVSGSLQKTYGGGGGTGGTGGTYHPSTSRTGGGGGGSAQGPDVSTIDIPDAIANAYNRDALIQEAIRRAKKLQASIPGAARDAKNDIVELLKGTQNLLEVRGVKDDLLRKALEELADVEKKRLEFETKADTIRRIRIGSGSFAALANVPVNSTTGVSLGGPQGPINVTLNLNGTVLTPAQLAQFADLVAAALKRQIANG